MKPGLFIVADDLGLHRSVNEGIVLGLKQGWIQGVSLMANGEAFNHAVAELKKLTRARIGLHLVLVEERPIILKKFPRNYSFFIIRYLLRLIKIEDIEKELRAQITRCLNSGIKIEFINSHQHLHLLPRILEVVIKIAKETNINYIRVVNEPLKPSWSMLRLVQLIFLKLFSWSARNALKNAGLTCGDYFVGFMAAGNLKRGDMVFAQKLSREFPDKIIEVGAHPGLEDKELRVKYKHWGNYNWRDELSVLKDF